jgi:hypothetical protein
MATDIVLNDGSVDVTDAALNIRNGGFICSGVGAFLSELVVKGVLAVEATVISPSGAVNIPYLASDDSIVNRELQATNGATIGVPYGRLQLLPGQQATNIVVTANEIVLNTYWGAVQPNGTVLVEPFGGPVPVFATLQALLAAVNSLSDEVTMLRAKVGV